MARAGKHILCEKPLTLHYPAARRVILAAKNHKVFFMEAFMYRAVVIPKTAKLVELVRQKVIGDLKLIQASFCFERPVDLKGRLFNRALGGGAGLGRGLLSGLHGEAFNRRGEKGCLSRSLWK